MKLVITEKDLSKIVGRFIIQLNTGENEVKYLTEPLNKDNLDYYLTKELILYHGDLITIQLLKLIYSEIVMN